MTKHFLLLTLSLLFLGGCHPLPNLIQQTQSPQPNCFLPEAALSQFLEDEHQFITSNTAQQKLMLEASKGSPERQANILSITRSKETLEQSLPLFAQIPLLPNKSCTADRYLYLRFRHVQANLAAIEEKDFVTARLNTAKLTIEKQQQQIDALTQIEQAITRQREEP
ncbi:MAG: hypothetical protein ACKVJE_08220 [Pseudomonadales bacterium]|jgi:hypothetical protein